MKLSYFTTAACNGVACNTIMVAKIVLLGLGLGLMMIIVVCGDQTLVVSMPILGKT